MMKKLLVISILNILMLTSCEDSSGIHETWDEITFTESQKGSWTDDDKEKAREIIEAELQKDNSFEGIEEEKEKIKECFVRGLEVNYDNFDQASFDREGMYKIAEECMLRWFNSLYRLKEREKEDSNIEE